jgi:hypothetical protein
VTSRDPSGPSGDGAPNPVIDDLLPVVANTVDTRMDSLKQWLVNVHLWSEIGQVWLLMMPKDIARYRRLQDAFFQFIDDIMPGRTLRFSHIDRRTWQVMIAVGDDVIPIDFVSQGTSSILGWVGTLQQRLYEIFPNSPQPEKEPALVLIDEIDAHMHPEWQRLLVPLVRGHFENLQVIATTHSPLIVGSLEADEMIFHFRRDALTGVIAYEVLCASAFEGMRSDQILTSSAFELSTTRSSGTTEMINDHAMLLGKVERNSQEQAQFEELRSKLSDVLKSGGTPAERQVEAAMRRLAIGPNLATADTSAMEGLPIDVEVELKHQLTRLFKDSSDAS